MSRQTALYCRVSTGNQLLARQRTSDYALDTLGIEPSVIEVYADKQAGTDTGGELMEAIESGAVKACQHALGALRGGHLSRGRSLPDEAARAVERAQHDDAEQAYRETAFDCYD